MKWNNLWPMFLCLALIGCLALPRSVPADRPEGKNRRELRVATYNVFGGTLDFNKTATVIRGMEADIVAMQEVSPTSVPSFERAFAREYPHRFFGGSQGLLSRFPLRNARYEKSQTGGNGFLFAEVSHRGAWLQVADLHFEPLRSWSVTEKLLLPRQIRRQAAVQNDEVTQVMAGLKPGLPTILAGDFNRVSDGVIDRLRASGYTDSFAAVTPHPDQARTLHFNVLGVKAGKRIDFIFHDHRFQTVESSVWAGAPSDHDAVSSVLRWLPAASSR